MYLHGRVSKLMLFIWISRYLSCEFSRYRHIHHTWIPTVSSWSNLPYYGVLGMSEEIIYLGPSGSPCHPLVVNIITSFHNIAYIHTWLGLVSRRLIEEFIDALLLGSVGIGRNESYRFMCINMQFS